MDRLGIDLYGTSRIGKTRAENQDRIMATALGRGKAVLAVADGMGGVAAGGLAAETAMRVLESQLNGASLDPQALARVIMKAGDQIVALAARDNKLYGMGTTLTAVFIEQGTANWAHVGDSRLYVVRDGRLAQISRDHRFLQDLIDAGDMTVAETLDHPLRHYLDQCVGSPDVQPDFGSFSLAKGDVLLLTTDGVHDHVALQQFLSTLESDIGLREIPNLLFKKAMQAGSTDDMSIVLGRVGCEEPD
ncbi:MAG TPA: serine/threonine-protein phosphatase [Desulfonatronum sp.]|nr:serine/threonine-protein phosphatase [Desulfonatronum sp.]